ncbi:MAG: MFS transporter, partial [Candidatus Hydrogenedentes bacterium]|nr:MFS transporter [Candidatus Hydrogenedentota bacterium]
MTSDPTTPETIAPEDPRRWRMLAFLSVAMLLSMTVWFSTNAIAPALEAEKGFSTG